MIIDIIKAIRDSQADAQKDIVRLEKGFEQIEIRRELHDRVAQLDEAREIVVAFGVLSQLISKYYMGKEKQK